MLEEGIKQFQEANCRGCQFVDEYCIGREACCTYYDGLIIKGNTCYTRIDAETETYRCVRCQVTVKREPAPALSSAAYDLRMCEGCYTGRRKPYYIEHRPTKNRALTYADSAQEACEANGWMIGDCYVQEARRDEPTD